MTNYFLYLLICILVAGISDTFIDKYLNFGIKQILIKTIVVIIVVGGFCLLLPLMLMGLIR